MPYKVIVTGELATYLQGKSHEVQNLTLSNGCVIVGNHTVPLHNILDIIEV